MMMITSPICAVAYIMPKNAQRRLLAPILKACLTMFIQQTPPFIVHHPRRFSLDGIMSIQFIARNSCCLLPTRLVSSWRRRLTRFTRARRCHCSTAGMRSSSIMPMRPQRSPSFLLSGLKRPKSVGRSFITGCQHALPMNIRWSYRLKSVRLVIFGPRSVSMRILVLFMANSAQEGAPLIDRGWRGLAPPLQPFLQPLPQPFLQKEWRLLRITVPSTSLASLPFSATSLTLGERLK